VRDAHPAEAQGPMPNGERGLLGFPVVSPTYDIAGIHGMAGAKETSS